MADGSKAIRTAVRKRWLKATFYACEFHLGRALAEAARCAGIWPADPARASLFERADGRSSFAAVHPDLVAEWDSEANMPLRPERIKATCDRTVQWRCLADSGHPPYRVSSGTRGETGIGCPIDRQLPRTGRWRDTQFARRV